MMATYTSDPRSTAESDLDHVVVMRAAVDQMAERLRSLGAGLTLNRDEVKSFLQAVDDAWDDTLGAVARLARTAGAEPSKPEFQPRFEYDRNGTAE